MSGYRSRRRSGGGRREVAGGGGGGGCGGVAEELDSPEKKAEEWKPVRRAQERSSRGLWSRLLPMNGGTSPASAPPASPAPAPPPPAPPRPVVRRELGIAPPCALEGAEPSS